MRAPPKQVGVATETNLIQNPAASDDTFNAAGEIVVASKVKNIPLALPPPIYEGANKEATPIALDGSTVA